MGGAGKYDSEKRKHRYSMFGYCGLFQTEGMAGVTGRVFGTPPAMEFQMVPCDGPLSFLVGPVLRAPFWSIGYRMGTEWVHNGYILGGSWDLLTAYNWAYNPRYNWASPYKAS